MSRCKLCSSEATNQRDRRSLPSKSSDSVRAALEEAFIQHGCVREDARQHCSVGFLCKKCFVLLEKRSRLHRELQSVNQEVQQKTSVAVTAFSLPHVSARSPLKRPASTTAPVPAKRLCLTRPTAASEPAVTVCTLADPRHSVTQVELYVSHSQITVGYSARPKQYLLTPSRRALGKTLGRRCQQSFAKHAYRDRAIRGYMLQQLSRDCKAEIKKLCSTGSVLLKREKDDLTTFTWKSFLEAVQESAPTIVLLLQSCIPTTTCLDHQAIVGVCVAILAKSRRSSACLVQRIVSLVLYAGHCSKQVSINIALLITQVQSDFVSMQVFTRLQRLGICLSHGTTLKTVDGMGQNHDQEVKKWAQELELSIPETGLEVCVCT